MRAERREASRADLCGNMAASCLAPGGFDQRPMDSHGRANLGLLVRRCGACPTVFYPSCNAATAIFDFTGQHTLPGWVVTFVTELALARRDAPLLCDAVELAALPRGPTRPDAGSSL